MPLDNNTLGAALYAVRNSFSNLTIDQIISTYGSLEDARLNQAKQEAAVIIDHFKANIILTIPGTGLVAGSVPVAGASITGTIA